MGRFLKLKCWKFKKVIGHKTNKKQHKNRKETRTLSRRNQCFREIQSEFKNSPRKQHLSNIEV